MSEKIYIRFLRLFPPHFRGAYGEEALQLFRDRADHERGFFKRLRLWLDLLMDLAISLPGQYGRRPPAVLAQSSGDLPSLGMIEDGLPRIDALLLGAVLSLAALSLGQFLEHRPSNVPAAWVEWSAQGRAAQRSSRMSSPIGRGVAGDLKLDAAWRRRVIEAAAANLKKDYLDPAVGQRVADTLLAREKAREYEGVSEGGAFAGLLTKQLQELSGDPHLDMVYSGRPLPERPPATTPEFRERYRQAMAAEQCTLRAAEIRRHDVGYLKLDSFPDAGVCESTVEAALAKLNGADALIIDLRDNRGGYANMVALIAAYLFDHPEYLYHPGEKTTERSWTRSPVSGSRLADKPLYVLTSPLTASAAEQFSYNMKMLRRGTLVGERTRGVAHAAVFRRIEEHFGMGIPEARGINPYSDRDWEGIGIEPDVRTPVADALATAERQAAERVGKK
jgi:hypothetical protein